MNSRILILASLVCTSSVASASFDMLLISDSNGMIHRYDPENHIYLGSFGSSRLQQPYGMALDQANNRVFVADFNRRSILSYNYNTGAFLDEFGTGTIQPFAVTLTNTGQFLIAGFGGTARYSSSGAFLNTFTTTDTAAITQTAAGDVLTAPYTTSNYVIQRYSLAGSFQNQSATITGSTHSHPAHFITRGSDMFLFSWNTTAANNGFRRVSMSGSSIVVGALLAESSQMGVNFGGAFGHGNTFWSLGRNNSGTASLAGYNYDLGNWDTPYTDSHFVNPFAVVNVVAPEPGSMIALGLGAAALMRRRRR